MRTRARLYAGAVALAIAAAVGAPAHADHRDFAGHVKKVSKQRVTVENRMGDRRSFVRGEKTRVDGRRSGWEKLRPGDEVVVDWHLKDRPARARHVRVIGRD
jgi:hypothetical protein